AHHRSAVLTVLFPLMVSLGLGGQEQRYRMAASVGAILAAAALVLCLERSSWIATGVGLLTLLSLTGRCAAATQLRRFRRMALIVGTLGLLAVAGFLVGSGVRGRVVERAGSIASAVQGKSSTFNWRVQKWRGAAAMAIERPLWGWGPGQYVLREYRYTHLGSPPEEVRRFGASFDDLAFNEYLQTAAELGFPGLALYLLVLGSFFAKGARAAQVLPEGLRRAILLGCLAAVAGQMVDAFANGSWRFAECSIFFWLALGLGTAVIRMADQPPRRSARPRAA